LERLSKFQSFEEQPRLVFIKGGIIVDGFTIKPHDFRDSVFNSDKIDDFKNSIKSYKHKKKTKVPLRKRFCNSCIFCQESGSVYYCLNPGSPKYKELVDEYEGCTRFVAYYY